MRVLGVDPGLTRCGLGVVEGGPGVQLRLAGTTVIRTPPGADIGSRLLVLDEQISRWLEQYQPDAVAVERVFSQHNVRTVMGTAQAGAVAIVCAARRGGRHGRGRELPRLSCAVLPSGWCPRCRRSPTSPRVPWQA